MHKLGQIPTSHHDDMPLSEQELSAMAITERVCSTISLVGASIAILTFLSRSEFRKPINRLIFYALWGNVLLNIATLISQSGMQSGLGSPLCQFQAFLIQWCVSRQTHVDWRYKTDHRCVTRFFPADAIWALCIACNVYLRFCYRYNSKQLGRLEWRYVLLCYSVPFIPALTLLFIQSPSRGKVYGSAVVSSPTFIYRYPLTHVGRSSSVGFPSLGMRCGLQFSMRHPGSSSSSQLLSTFAWVCIFIRWSSNSDPLA